MPLAVLLQVRSCHSTMDACAYLSYEDSDKPLLREDAKRLFLDETGDSAKWDSVYDVKYKSWQQHARHAERDGTAFASVALPAHYSAIYSVFDHLKQRLGADWSFERVIDWGSGTGSGLWFVLYPRLSILRLIIPAGPCLTHFKIRHPLAQKTLIHRFRNPLYRAILE